MGLVEYAASSCLAFTGFALAAPFLETKVPALEPATRHVHQWVKFIAGFGVAGGALGFLVAPLALGFSVYQHGLAANILAIPLLGLLLLGCAASVALGVVAFRRGPPTEPHSGELDKMTIAGFGAMAYGSFLWLVFTIVIAIA